jgi:hypothetical protein
MSVVNAASVQSAANAVAVMHVAVVVAGALSAPKAALSAPANAVLNAAKVALSHVANAAQKAVRRAVLNALLLKAAVKMVAMQTAPAKLAQTCAPKAVQRASPVPKGVLTAPAVIAQNAQSVVSVVPNAPARPGTPPKKNWHSPIRPPWPPLHAVMSLHRKPVAKSASPVKRANHASRVSHAKAVVKAAVNAVVVARNVVMTHLPLTAAKPLLLIAMRPTSVLNALSRLSQPTLHRKATSPLLAKTTPKSAHPANAAAVTVMVANAVNVVNVLSRRQTNPLTPTPQPSRQRSRSTPRLALPQPTSPARLWP